MTGSWEIILILIVLGIFIGPWMMRRATNKRKRSPRSTQTPPPQAREVDYEIPDEP